MVGHLKVFESSVYLKVYFVACLIAAAGKAVAEPLPPVGFNAEIRPLLSRHCLNCHGPDSVKRKADLRLDIRQNAVETGAIVPGQSDTSEMVVRLLSDDPDETMPPPGKGEPLTVAQKELLKRWIDEGAHYEGHWAFQQPQALPVPETMGTPDFPARSPIDAFVKAKLDKKGLQPAPPADRERWLRRVTMDLTGLPPTLAQIDSFLADPSETAFETVVDRLLASQAYGERMANDWLDLARYGDTYGRHEDFDCVTWPYRDWVIEAFNENLPYDQFVLLQTAGDLLPNPTLHEIVPTAFNRLHVQMNEAGSNEEEFRCEHVSDRVKTNSATFLGLTMECCKCHDHKFDPLSMRDYYSMGAFFDNIDELGLYCRFTNGIPPPSTYVYKDAAEEVLHAELLRQIEGKVNAREALKPEAETRFHAWLKEHRPPSRSGPAPTLIRLAGWFSKPRPTATGTSPVDYFNFEELLDDRRGFTNLVRPDSKGELIKKARLVEGPAGLGKALGFNGDNGGTMSHAGEFGRTDPFSLAVWVKLDIPVDEAVILHRTRSALEAAHRGYEISIENNQPVFRMAHFWPGNGIGIRAAQALTVGKWTHLAATYDGSSKAAGMKLYVDGQPVACEVERDHLYKDILYLQEWGDFDPEQVADANVVENVYLTLGGRINSKGFREGALDEIQVFDRELTPPEVAHVHGDLEDRAEAEWFAWYLREIDEPWRRLSGEIKALRDRENQLVSGCVELMVMKEMSPRRQTYLLERGQWNKRGASVSPATPAVLPPMPQEYPRNRLGFGKWLTDGNHPLTARVAVNRLWQTFFGKGIVGTSEDFGTQGELPSHPELLDWLALHFQATGWNVKALCREIALSSTYRQSSLPSDRKLLVEDPDNRLLARGPRNRLTAEQLRDQVLAVSGLLAGGIGGPSVKPYQPAGLWEEGGTQHSYHVDTGIGLYRRSLYTFWRKTMAPPSMTIFDAPSREFCQVRRQRSANPLQALVVQNDPQYVEAARVLAEKLVRDHPGTGPQDDAYRAVLAFRALTGCRPSPEQQTLLAGFIADARAGYAAETSAARDLLEKNGDSKSDAALSPVEVAATTVMVRMLFGYDGCLCKL